MVPRSNNMWSYLLWSPVIVAVPFCGQTSSCQSVPIYVRAVLIEYECRYCSSHVGSGKSLSGLSPKRDCSQSYKGYKTGNRDPVFGYRNRTFSMRFIRLLKNNRNLIGYFRLSIAYPIPYPIQRICVRMEAPLVLLGHLLY